MADVKLTKWKLLLDQLDVNLEAFLGISLKYSDSLFTIDEAKIKNYICQKNYTLPQCSLSTLNETQLKFFESKTGLILPQEYKNFFQVFGSGRFGLNGFVIECPDIQDIKGYLGNSEGILGACKNEFEGLVEIEELFDHAYLFGGGGDCVSFFFDLRTYNKQDQNYEIYGGGCDQKHISKIGRDFLAFVRDICIGKREQRISPFPELLVGGTLYIDKDDPRYRTTTFLPFPIFEE